MEPIDLAEHPEGGRFKEVFRSPVRVLTEEDEKRSALTHIYFSLEANERSKFHKLSSDEVWNLYQGQGIHLYLWNGTRDLPELITLSAETNRFCYVVPAGYWQAAVPLDGKVLVGCSVAPGFEYCDFEIMNVRSEAAQNLNLIAPQLECFLSPS